MNAPVRVRTHNADGETVEREGATVTEALAVADLGTREGRIAACGEAAAALLASGNPALMFVGSALSRWLETGGRLERDHLRVFGPARSHRTVAVVWRALCAARAALNSDAQRSPNTTTLPIQLPNRGKG